MAFFRLQPLARLITLLLLRKCVGLNIILNNDDGFASVQIRETQRALTAAGHNG
jgi:hypothetical protein